MPIALLRATCLVSTDPFDRGDPVLGWEAPQPSAMRLTTQDHDRAGAGMTYVYPVVSRRAGGVSVGINLNPNNACNWRCIYCQVPGLVRGAAPQLDLELLERELETLLRMALDPAWMERHVPAGSRRLKDIAFSGNGEPTSSPQFPSAVERAAGVLARTGQLGKLGVVLITNGSLIHQVHVQSGLERLSTAGGEVWFKLDSATRAGRERLNDTRGGLEQALENLVLSTHLCPTLVQTMALDFEGPTLAGEELTAYCGFLNAARERGARLRGVLLYGLARPSYQPEASRLVALDEGSMEEIAERIRERTGLLVRLSP